VSDRTVAGTGKGATDRQRKFGARVRARRRAVGMTQEALAHRAGVHRSYVGSLETGGRNPSLETIARLATALEVDAADLVAGLQAVRGRRGT
jgi:transcriptional regulator with XRE-family HTH domain